ncbi:MAG: hypothetical protein PF503_04940 [Desulfobacula sp.]|jgi:hypothetical protein|nr:hypothetical protein [Desulfobacula sp.]
MILKSSLITLGILLIRTAWAFASDNAIETGNTAWDLLWAG